MYVAGGCYFGLGVGGTIVVPNEGDIGESRRVFYVVPQGIPLGHVFATEVH